MRHRNILGNWKYIATTAALATGFLLFAGAPGAKADDCRDRLIHADHKLHEAIEHHGPESKQAEHWRHELREAREYCWVHGRHWWDADGNRWRTERDWDDHDHDRR